MKTLAKNGDRLIIQLGDRIFETTEEEINKVALGIRPYIVKFSDVPKLMEEHKYLFSNCDPIWN